MHDIDRLGIYWGHIGTSNIVMHHIYRVRSQKTRWKTRLSGRSRDCRIYMGKQVETYASTRGPGYGSDFWYRALSFTQSTMVGMNRIKHQPTLAQKPFCINANRCMNINSNGVRLILQRAGRTTTLRLSSDANSFVDDQETCTARSGNL